MKKPTKAPAAPRKPKAAAPAAVLAKPTPPVEPVAIAPEAAAPADEALAQRDVAEHENETRVIPPDHAPELTVAPHAPTQAERDAIKDHLELRLAELATYVRSEAHKHGMKVGDFGDHLADALRAMLASD